MRVRERERDRAKERVIKRGSEWKKVIVRERRRESKRE